MASGGYGPVLRQVDRLLGVHGTASGLGEGALLRRFADGRDEAAFEALVTRHGPMVLGTCRRILADPHDVDDAFQATFLVLARKAGSIRDGDRLGPWLHGVARRVATRSRTLSARRAARERPGAEERASAGADPSELVELRAALDEELARLPEKYRAPLVLCYLEGLTHDEAAVQLSWPVGTVRSRLARGRDRLRSRLTRRGLSPSAAVPAILPAPAIPEVLISSTVRIATIAGLAPARVASLAKGALMAMMWHKLKVIGAVGLAAGGVGVTAWQGVGGEAAVPAQSKPEDPKSPEGDRAESRDFAGRLVDARRKEEEIKYRLNLMEILHEQASAELSPLPDVTRAEESLNRTNENIKKLEGDLAARTASTEVLVKRAKEQRPPTAPTLRVDDPLAAGPAEPAIAPGSGRQATQPAVLTLPGSPTTFAVIPGEHDRVTMIDAKSQKRATFRLPRPATSISLEPNGSNDLHDYSPESQDDRRLSEGLVGLALAGPELTRIAVFDRNSMAWSEHNLAKPLTAVSPQMNRYTSLVGFDLVGPEITEVVVFDAKDRTWRTQALREPGRGRVSAVNALSTVSYQAGRFLYLYNRAARKWGVLELKKALPADGQGGGLVQLNSFQGGKLVVPEGDVIHIYDEETGEWTHIDTKDDK